MDANDLERLREGIRQVGQKALDTWRPRFGQGGCVKVANEIRDYLRSCGISCLCFTTRIDIASHTWVLACDPAQGETFPLYQIDIPFPLYQSIDMGSGAWIKKKDVVLQDSDVSISVIPEDKTPPGFRDTLLHELKIQMA